MVSSGRTAPSIRDHKFRTIRASKETGWVAVNDASNQKPERTLASRVMALPLYLKHHSPCIRAPTLAVAHQQKSPARMLQAGLGSLIASLTPDSTKIVTRGLRRSNGNDTAERCRPAFDERGANHHLAGPKQRKGRPGRHRPAGPQGLCSNSL